MSTQRYSVTPHSIETLLTWGHVGGIAIFEIQRPVRVGADQGPTPTTTTFSNSVAS